jgi:hypothetical protein
MGSKLKNILILTYYFPPAGGPGVQRVLKFIKYLPEYGWNPIVVTVKDGDFPAHDPSLFSDIPEQIQVFRVPAVEPYQLYRKLTGKDKAEKIPVGILARDATSSLKDKIAKWIRANFFIPDARIGWIFPVYKQASRIIKKYDIDAILSSSPPHSVQITANLLNMKFNLPWICDLRDPWTEIYYYQHIKRLFLSNLMDKKLEEYVLHSADKIVTVSPQLVNQFKAIARHTEYLFIPNGYDVSDFNAIKDITNNRLFTLSYIGNFKANQNIKSLWSAIRELLNEDPDFARSFQLYITGKIHPDILEALQKAGLEQHLKKEDYVPHSIAVKRMQESSVLLFPIPKAPDNQGILTGKIFEYLASNTPLLSIGPPEGDAADIIRQLEGGPMFNYSDKVEIKEYIKKLFDGWKSNCLNSFSPNHKKVRKYNRKELTGKLAANINKLYRKKYGKSRSC